jgi:uncharacterized protein (TIRG00374 family)
MPKMKGGKYLKAIGLILLTVILYHVDLEEVWRQLKLSDPVLLSAAIILIVPQVALRAFRWQKMLSRQAIHCPFRYALSFYFASIYIGLLTPGRLGEVAKAFFLKQRGWASISQALPSVIADRCLDLYCLMMVALISLYPLGLGFQSRMTTGLICIAVALSPWLLLYHWQSSGRVGMLRKIISNLLSKKRGEAFASFSQNAGQLLSCQIAYLLIVTVASYGIYFLQTFFIARAIGLGLDYLTVAMVVSIAILVGFIPVTIAGLGTREAVFIFLLGRFGISPASALSFAFLYNLVYIVCVGLISAVFWMRLPDRREVKNVSLEQI